MKRILLAVAVAAVALCGQPRAQATTLTPGQTKSPDSFGLGNGNISIEADTGLQNFSSGSNFSGTVRELVLKGDPSNQFGGLDFAYQVTITKGTLADFVASSFIGAAGGEIGVGQVTGPAAGRLPKGTAWFSEAAWSSDASKLTLSFANPVSANATTYVVLVRTGNTTYTPGQIVVEGSGSATVHGFAAAPEPGSMVLLASCFVGLGGTGLWRRLRRRRLG